MKYVYPAVFSQEDVGVGVIFPDLPGCVSQGDDYQNAFDYAREGLSLHIFGILEDGEKLPTPSRLEEIELENNEALALIEVDLDGFKPDWSLTK
ncbi:MAG: type II toxin-antitoxin system HicB family antitoxin [Selenomonadaceae bacterium]|nr:type II toxin-antitoxin system HicB family antitoxin [Selenomonadaceae bacterium]MBQ7630622.1 type II toxin-antitoxin system HicB family antitoxin [Selenomonadaceae bacterium]